MTPEEKTELLDLMALWRNEGLTPLSHIVGFSHLLLDGELGELNEEQRRTIEIVFKAGIQATACWNIANTYLRLQYGTDIHKYSSVRLRDVVDEATSHLNKLKTFSYISTDVPLDLPLIEERWPLQAVFVYILDSDFLRHYNKSATITARPQDGAKIQVQIELEGIIKPDADLNPQRLLHPGGSISVAQLIIVRHGGELQIQNIQENLVFKFTLPIWNRKVD
ncbi:MAG: hypothetical protein KJ069_24650 [Anaerolineae bacterium]|nr:hypothetical protein [Anaerolineae bacterium]